ncbi:MAG: gliding motility lipoprotein GldH [Tannerellaceae bacterium]|nr:gliding motility lipoprotein GldH [Tannerellaceae bacterium]
MINRRVNQTNLSRKLKNFLFIIICFLCFSCENKAIYNQYQAIADRTWKKDKEYYFTFYIDDITVPYNLILDIRNNNLYPFQNLWVFYTIEPPIGTLQRDTLECMLADDFGKWYGKGISLFHSSFPLRTSYMFPYEGQYTYSFRQGMRTEVLKGIQEIGFRVEKAR